MSDSRIHVFTHTKPVSAALALLTPNSGVAAYQQAMIQLGHDLGQQFVAITKMKDILENLLVVSTAEDADYLTSGFLQALSENSVTYKLAVFWNDHYALPNGESVAPIINSYLQDNYQECRRLVMLKSIISGSCVVRTNFMKLIMDIGRERLENVAVIAPVMYKDSDQKLSCEFPPDIHNKFSFYTFRIDSKREKDGTVIPGIGGQIYPLLGLDDQPARMNPGYVPNFVKARLFA